MITSREEFVAAAVREAERRLNVPAGWWGTYKHVRAPGGAAVRSGLNGWRIYGATGRFVSAHDSRAYAIKKAAKLYTHDHIHPFPDPT